MNTFPGNYLSTKAEYIVNLVAEWEYDGMFLKFNYVRKMWYKMHIYNYNL